MHVPGVRLAAASKCAARQERIPSRSYCCHFYSLALSGCENCGNRFYGLALQKKVSVVRAAKTNPDLVRDLPVLVYGRGDDEEPFQEETNVRRLNFRGGLIALATKVAPSQQLILINPTAEEDQRCRVAFIGEQHRGRNMIGIQFSHSAWEFWRIGNRFSSS